MKCLVTGGAGFIGSHLVDRLIKEDHKTVILDNLSTGKRENINPKAKFYEINIQDPKIFQIFKKEKPEIVFPFAAQIDVRKSVEDPFESAKDNILGSLNLLENCRRFKINLHLLVVQFTVTLKLFPHLKTILNFLYLLMELKN